MSDFYIAPAYLTSDLKKKILWLALSEKNNAYFENVHDKRAVSSLTMVYANLIPMQFLGPWPKAMNDGG